MRLLMGIKVNPKVGSESAPHFNIGPCGRGFELSRRRKKRAIGTCPYSPVSEWSPPAGRPRGGALTKVGSESAPHFNIGPYGRGFELSRRRKKRAIGTCPYSPVSEWSPPAGRPRGRALTSERGSIAWVLWLVLG